MSKAIVIGVVSVGGAGAVGIGGYALFGNGFGFGGGSDTSTQPVTTTTQESTTSQGGSTETGSSNKGNTPDPSLGTITSTNHSSSATGGTYSSTLEKISETQDLSNWKCFTTAFSGLSLTTTNTSTEGNLDLSSVDFGTPTESEISGCLLLQTMKVEFGSNGNKKYTGILSWVWALKGSSKGLVAFGVAKVGKENNDLSVEGAVYVLKKDNSQWSVEKKHTSSSKTITETSSNQNCQGKWKKLPAANNNKLSGEVNNCYWSWLDDGDELTKIASSGEAVNGSATTNVHLYEWKYNNSNTDKIYDCFKDPQLEWFDNLFGTTNSTLKTKLDSWKGKWDPTSRSS